MTNEQINMAARHFIIAAIWADCPEGTHPRATKAAQDWAREFVGRFYETCPALCDDVLGVPGYGWIDGKRDAPAAFGHDLYLTARGHGTGFWDRTELTHNETGRNLGEAISDVLRDKWREFYCEPQFYRGWLYFL